MILFADALEEIERDHCMLRFFYLFHNKQRFSTECDTVVQSVTYVVLWIVDSPSILQIKENYLFFFL